VRAGAGRIIVHTIVSSPEGYETLEARHMKQLNVRLSTDSAAKTGDAAEGAGLTVDSGNAVFERDRTWSSVS